MIYKNKCINSYNELLIAMVDGYIIKPSENLYQDIIRHFFTFKGENFLGQ